MNDLIQNLSENAVGILKKEGHLNPIAFLLDSDRVITIVELKFTDDEEKYKSYLAVGKIAEKAKANRVILINDVAARIYKTKKEAEYAYENYDHESPLSYPESMRLDGILFIDINIESECIKEYFLRYERENEEFKFHKLSKLGSFVEEEIGKTNDFGETGVFSGILIENVLRGYNKS